MGNLNAAEALPDNPANTDHEFSRGLSLFDSIMLVAGVMIGSGIFIVSADMARNIGSAGWLLVAWAVAGILTISGALCYGELSAMMPQAGGMYVYLREAYSPLWGFLYGWTLFTVIQTGTIAAVAVASRGFWECCGLPSQKQISAFTSAIFHPLRTLAVHGPAFSAFSYRLLTFANTRGLRYGKIVQNVFTVSKMGALAGLILLGLFIGRNATALHLNFSNPWHATGVDPVSAGLDATTLFGLFVAICLSQTGSLFSADSWHNIAFAAGEVKRPERNRLSPWSSEPLS